MYLQEDEKEQARRSAAVDKERKDLEREESRRKKENERESKERQRLEELQSKEKNKLILKFTKEKRKSESVDRNKIRALYRKDFTADLKRIRGEACASVLQHFDEEETLQEQAERTQSTVASAEEEENACPEERSPLDEFFELIPTCESIFLPTKMNLPSYSLSTPCMSLNNGNHDAKTYGMTANNCSENQRTEQKNDGNKEVEDRNRGSGDFASDVIWDDVFQTANCLSVFNNFLQLQMPLKLDILIGKVVSVTQAGVACHERTLQSVLNKRSDMIMAVKDEKIDEQNDSPLSSMETSSCSVGEEMRIGTKLEISEETIMGTKEEISEVVKEEMEIDDKIKEENVNTADTNVEKALTDEFLKSEDTIIDCIQSEEVKSEDTGESESKGIKQPEESNESPMEIEGEHSSGVEISDSGEVLFFISANHNDFLSNHLDTCLFVFEIFFLVQIAFIFITLFIILPLLPLLFLPLLHLFFPPLLLLFCLPLLLHLFFLPLHFPLFLPFLSSFLSSSFSSSLSSSFSFSCFCLQAFDLPSLLESLADMDRLHLCLINNLTGDLHSILDLGIHYLFWPFLDSNYMTNTDITA